MGAKQTKVEENSIPSSSITCHPSTQMAKTNLNVIDDPRSPNGCRTPINLSCRRIDTNTQLVHVEMLNFENPADNPIGALRKRFLKSFACNLNDPRSPSLHLNRTPLVYEDTLEKTLNLDDTFADLFVESRAPEPTNESKLNDEFNDVEMPDDLPSEMTSSKLRNQFLPQTPDALQQQFDPRSPSVGVERTPILFSDNDDEVSEDVFLESILATLTLNLDASPNSSIVSITSPNVKTASTERNGLEVVYRPTNKHLDRVRIGKKPISKGPYRKPKRRLSRQQIYEDQENHLNLTPKLKMSQTENNDSPKGIRTPLSCVRNRNSAQVRSRSVEASAKSIKTRLPLTSFDDSLNPNETHKVLSLQIMRQGSHDSVQL